MKKYLHFFTASVMAMLLNWGSVGSLSAAPTVPEGTKVCFRCAGEGRVKCTAPTCTNGMADCPGHCLKLSQGNWIHMTVAGHSLEELWQKFPSQTGIGWQAWNQDHLGDAIEYQNGKAINLGKCKLCVGTTRVPCAICQGQGQVTCPICNGKKIVSLSWSLSDSPKMKFRPKVFKLKNGREIVGKQLMVIGNDTTIHTETGDVNIKVSDIVTEAKLTPPK